MAEKSKILFIGGTGYLGKFIVEASIKAGHPSFLLVRESTVADPVKGQLVEKFKNSGVNLVYVCMCLHIYFFVWVRFVLLIKSKFLLQGDLYNHESLVKAIKQVDVVISTVGALQLADQTKIIAAIKEAGNIKVRLFPQ